MAANLSDIIFSMRLTAFMHHAELVVGSDPQCLAVCFSGRAIRHLLLEPGGSREPLCLLTAALGGGEGRDKVLQQRQGGWCPTPAAFLKSVAPQQHCS